MQPPAQESTGGDPLFVFREAFEQSHEAIGISNLAGVIHMTNPALLRLFGYQSESQVLGQPVLSMMAPVAREWIASMMRRRAQGQNLPGAYRARGLRQDGTEMAIDVRTAPLHLQGQTFIMSILREIPEQDVAAPVASTADAFYRAVFNVNSAVKILIDPTTGALVDANDAAVELYGWPREQLLRMRISEINTLSVDEVHQEMERARTGRRGYFRFRHRTAHRGVRHVEVYSGPVELDERQLLLSIVHDVTDRDELEARLDQSRRLELAGRLAGGVAHDFNNLLTVILSSVDLLDDERFSPQALSLIADIRHAAERASDLTGDLLALGRRQVLENKPLRPGELLSRMRGMLQRALGERYSLVLELQPDLPVVRADAGRLEQVVMNLALNARDATPGGGRIVIRGKRVLLDRPDPDGVPPGEWAVIEVEDNGTGMDENTRLRIFEPFFTTKPETGSGLGLSTAHGIVTQSEGHVTVRSEPGKGSLFRVFLPALATAEIPDPPAVTSPPAGPGGRIALIEDEPAVRKLLRSALERSGFQVDDFPSADVFLRESGPQGFDALVSDVVMPGMSGLELARHLEQESPGLPVVLISGETGPHMGDALPGNARFLAKPLTGEALADALRAAARSTATGDG